MSVPSPEVEEGPGVLFKPFITMEDLLDKLKLLNYEAEFSSQMRMRPLNRFLAVLVNCYSLININSNLQALLRAADQPRGAVLHVLLPGCLAHQEVR